MPAHIVEAQSGVADLQAAYDGQVTADLEKVAAFWNEGFIGTGGALKPDVMISGGPYKLADWVAGQSLTLERNDAYWGTPGNADSIVFRLVADATAQPQALQNEEVQIISPQPNPDLLAQLEGIDGVTVAELRLVHLRALRLQLPAPAVPGQGRSSRPSPTAPRARRSSTRSSSP